MKAAEMLLGSYRTGEANDPEVYISAILRIMMAYPLDLVMQAVDPLSGIPSKIEWLPKPFEVKKELDALHAPILKKLEWDRRTVEQMKERQRDDELRGSKRQSYDEFKAEMSRRGMPVDATRPDGKTDGRPFERYTDDKLRAMYPQKPAAT